MNQTKLHTLISLALPLTNNSCMYFKHSALIVRNGNVVATGFNTERHHAEMTAVRKLQRVLCGKRGQQRG